MLLNMSSCAIVRDACFGTMSGVLAAVSLLTEEPLRIMSIRIFRDTGITSFWQLR